MRTLSLALCAAALLTAESKKAVVGTFESDRIQMEATLYSDRSEVKRLLGSDFDGSIMVVDLTVTPIGEEPLDIQHDQFLLFSSKDAQKSPPFHPAQLAGRGALVLGSSASGGTYVGNNPNAPVIGGLPGTGGRPTQIGGNGGTVGGGGGAATSVENQGMTDTKEDPVLRTLKAKVFPEGKTLKPVSGLLYFGIEGKHKPKDLELFYRGPAGKFAIRFKN